MQQQQREQALPDIRDRIVRFERLPASSLVPHPLNWHTHPESQRQAFRDVLDQIGLVGVELVYPLADGRYGLIDGHMRAEELGDHLVWCGITDLSEDEAEGLLAAYDAIGQLAGVHRGRADALIARAHQHHQDAIALVLARTVDRSQLLMEAARARRLGVTAPLGSDPADDEDEDVGDDDDLIRGVPADEYQSALDAWANDMGGPADEDDTGQEPPDDDDGDADDAPGMVHVASALSDSAYAHIAALLSPKPATLLRWLSRLYHLAADYTQLDGNLGPWPEELGDFLEGMLYAHAAAPTSFTPRSGLLLSDDRARPRAHKEALILFSGGRDSIAAAKRAEWAGYSPHCVYVRRVNRGFYMVEEPCARRIADLMGWRYTALDPEGLPDVRMASACKNQYCMALALDQFDIVPGAYAFGNHRYEDVNSVSFYSDMWAAFEAWHPIIAHTYGTDLERLPASRDEVEVEALWRDLPDAVRNLTTSCMTPPYWKPLHRRRMLAEGIPLLDYECGVCEKCSRAALIEHKHFGVEYPPDYLTACRLRIAQYGAVAPDDVFSHPKLVTWGGTGPDGEHYETSQDCYLSYVCGIVAEAVPRLPAQPVIRISEGSSGDDDDVRVHMPPKSEVQVVMHARYEGKGKPRPVRDPVDTE